MSLSWLLFVRSFRHSWKRFILVAGTIGIGVVILLLFASGLNGLSNRMGDASWRQTIIQTATAPQQTVPDTEPLYATLSSGSNVDSFWRDKQIDVTRLAAGGHNSPQFQDLPTPSTGEYYVSPGLKKIIDNHPEDSIGSRFGEKLLGLIPDKYITSPDELSVVSSMDISEAKHLESIGASIVKLYHIDQKPAIDSKYSGIILSVLYIGIFILLFPIMLLVSVATQLGGSQREQRYAALRLIGSSKAQVRRVMMIESLAASAVGIGIGLVLYVAARSLMLEFRFNGMRFWPHEVVIPTPQIIGIIVVTLGFSVITNWWAIRRVQTSPLGVNRRVSRRKQPHWWRVIPLFIGIGIVGFVVSPLFDTTQDSQKNIAALLIFAGVIVLMFGLVSAGPFVTQKLAALIARHTKHAEVLLSMRYVSFNARGVFRSVVGVVIAMFVGSFLLACAAGMQSYMTQSVTNNGYSRLFSDSVLVGSYPRSTPLPEKQEDVFRSLDYVHNVAEFKEVGYSVAVMPCHVATQYTSVRCPDNKRHVGVNFNKLDVSKVLYGTTEVEVYKQISDISPYFDMSVTIPNYFIQIDNKNIDKLRSFITMQYVRDQSVSVSLFDGTSSNVPFINPIIKELAELAYIGIGITVFVSIVSLAISTIGGLLERRRSLTTLRLGGMSVGGLRRVVVIQSLVPLLSATVIASGFGLVIGSILINLLTEGPPDVLSLSYILMLGGCIFAAMTIIALILPLTRLISDPDKTQTE